MNLIFFNLAVLVIYLKSELQFNEDTSTAIYHWFRVFFDLSPIFGAILADQYIGIFKTTCWMSLIKIVGLSMLILVTITILNLPRV